MPEPPYSDILLLLYTFPELEELSLMQEIEVRDNIWCLCRRNLKLW